MIRARSRGVADADTSFEDTDPVTAEPSNEGTTCSGSEVRGRDPWLAGQGLTETGGRTRGQIRPAQNAEGLSALEPP